MIRNYRCYACRNASGAYGRDFTADIPAEPQTVKLPDGTVVPAAACPACGLSNTHPALGQNIAPVSVIHYEPPFSEQFRHRAGCGHVACDPTAKTATDDNLRYTGEPAVVNCPACKSTPEFKKATGGVLHSSFDIPLTVAKDGLPIVPELLTETAPKVAKEKKANG